MARIILVQIVGGLGNQMFQYAAGRQLAIANDAPLKLDVSEYANYPDREYLLHHFRIDGLPASKDELAAIARKRDDRGWRRQLRRLGIRTHDSVICFKERGYGYDPDLGRQRGAVYLRGYWQSERYFRDIAPRIRREFQARDRPDPAARELIREAESVPSVAVHVRRGDYARNPDILRVHGLCTPEYYTKAAEFLESRFVNLRYYVFSDDPEWARAHIALPGIVTHVNLDVDGRRRDLADFAVMRRCRHFVLANSSFSWWAAWLGEHPEKSVVAPARWFAEESLNSPDRLPDGWHVVAPEAGS